MHRIQSSPTFISRLISHCVRNAMILNLVWCSTPKKGYIHRCCLGSCRCYSTSSSYIYLIIYTKFYIKLNLMSLYPEKNPHNNNKERKSESLFKFVFFILLCSFFLHSGYLHAGQLYVLVCIKNSNCYHPSSA